MSGLTFTWPRAVVSLVLLAVGIAFSIDGRWTWILWGVGMALLPFAGRSRLKWPSKKPDDYR